jgi:ATP-dependent exoDNAse (exonuclease V) beta subunit
MLNDVSRLKSGLLAEMPDFYGFANWEEVVELAKQPEGEYLNTFVRLVTEYGEGRLLRIVNQCVPEERAEMIVSTAHKAKGFEWERVLVYSDFDDAFGKVVSFQNQKLVIHNRQQFEEEVRTFYVATTRAKVAVELPFRTMSYFGLTNTRADAVGFPVITAEGTAAAW